MIWRCALLWIYLAVPVTAQTPDVISVCAKSEIDAPDCNMVTLANALGLLEADDVRPYGAAGMESFAMLTALRYAASSLAFIIDEDPCFAEEERTGAEEVWANWVRRPETLPADLALRYDQYESILDKLMQLELECP